MTPFRLPVGRFGGIPVTIGPSWLLIVPIVGLALFAGIESSAGDLWERWVVAGIGTLLMFVSVLVHEYGHALMAAHRGIDVERIVVFLFGGYSEMDLDDADPMDDIAVSAAGPIASAVLALVVLAVAIPAPDWAGTHRTLGLLGIVNLAVALFNMLPGFPLDGGRIVRGMLLIGGFDRREADVLTSRLGIGLGVLAVAAGVWMAVRGEAGMILALPVGVMLLVIAAAAHPRRPRPVDSAPAPASEEI